MVPGARQKARTPKGLSRAGVVDTAVRLVERDGVDALSMRRLGAEMGVEAMSLYRHVRNKHDLMVAMADHVLAPVAAHDDIRGDATTDGTALAQALRHALLRHPNTTRLFATNMTLHESEAIQRLTAKGFTLLDRLGTTPQAAAYTYGTVLAFVIGQVLLEIAQRKQGSPPTSIYDPDRAFDLGLHALLTSVPEAADSDTGR